MRNRAKSSDFPAPHLSCQDGRRGQPLFLPLHMLPHSDLAFFSNVLAAVTLNGTYQFIGVVMVFFEHKIRSQAVGARATSQSHGDDTSTTPVPTSQPQSVELNALPSSR